MVSRSGSWFKLDETYLGQGKEKARNFLIENPDVTQDIHDRIMSVAGFGTDDDDDVEIPLAEDENEPNS